MKVITSDSTVFAPKDWISQASTHLGFFRLTISEVLEYECRCSVISHDRTSLTMVSSGTALSWLTTSVIKGRHNCTDVWSTFDVPDGLGDDNGMLGVFVEFRAASQTSEPQ